MKFIRAGAFLVALGAAASSLVAQDSPFPRPDATGPTDWTESPIKPEIGGFVKYKDSGETATSISVRLETATGTLLRQAQTGRLGEFLFPRVACGDYVVAVDAPGYVPVRIPVEHSFIPLEPIRIYLVPVNSEVLATAGNPSGTLFANIPERARKEYEKGLQQLSRKKVEESIIHLRRAVEIYPNYDSAYLQLGWVYFRQRNFSEARDVLERALKVNPLNAAGHAMLGSVRRQQNQLPEAVQELELSLSLEEASWWAHLDLGEILLKLGKTEQAYPHILRAHQMNPALASIHLQFYNTLILRNDYAGAAAELDEFLRLFPRHSLVARVQQQREALRAKLQPAQARR